MYVFIFLKYLIKMLWQCKEQQAIKEKKKEAFCLFFLIET